MVAPSAASAAKFLYAPPRAVSGFLFYGPDGLQIAARAEDLVRTLSSKTAPNAEILRFHESDLSADPGRVAAELATGSLFGGTKIVWLTALPVKAQATLAGIAAAP